MLDSFAWLARRAVAAALVAGVVVLASFAAAGGSASANRLAGVRPLRLAPRIPAGARAIGAVPTSTPIDLSIALAPRDEAALTSFIAAASTPGSPTYHRYLAPGQFAARFGPASRAIDAVREELRALGVGAATLSRDHLFVSAMTTAGAVESAFRVELTRYRLDDGQVGFSAAESPMVSGVLASSAINGILGMDNLSRPRPLLERSARVPGAQWPRAATRGSPLGRPGPPKACSAAATAAAAADSDTDNQIAQAYQLSNLYSAGATGAAQTIALYELEPYASTDLAAFQTCYGTSVTVENINEFGGPGTGAGSGEAAMDIENVVALAPGAQVLVYQGPEDASDSESTELYDDMVAPDNAKQLSTSWGECELDESASEISSEYPIFQEAASYGETFYAAAGDDGSEDCLEDGTSNASKLAVDDPGSQPYVVSVGGLTLDSLTPTETVWNDYTVSDGGDGDGAGGGGISTEWTMPSWQAATGVINEFSSSAPCGASAGSYCREVPDVSGDADPDVGGWVIYWKGSWEGGNGGTSATAPLWAALTAVVNSQCKSGTTAGFDLPALYQAAGTSGNFTDVTSGNNDYTGKHDGDYPATAGYDLASGLGSPLALGLAASLCTASGLASPSLAVSAPATGAVGSAIAASSISGALSGGSSPTGTVTFTVFGPQSTAPTSCTTGGTDVGSASVTGDGSYHPSSGFTPTSGGDYWWYADYSGDAANRPAASACGPSMAETAVPGSPPTVTAVKPSSGPVAGGTKVTVSGTNFVPGSTNVDFGSTPGSAVTVSSSTSLTVISPGGSAGSVNVTVTTSGETSPVSPKDLFAYGAPTLTSFTPGSGITGSAVILTGSGFATGETVTFGSLTASVTVLSATSMRASVPNGDPGPSSISITDKQGSATSSTQFTPTMSLTGFTPSSGAAGTTVTVSGFGFTAASIVKFDHTVASVSSESSTQLVVSVPSGASTGFITVTNPKGSTPTGSVASATKYTV